MYQVPVSKRMVLQYEAEDSVKRWLAHKICTVARE